MIYIPEEWVRDPQNEKEIYEMLEESSGCLRIDRDTEDKKIASRLKELGEDKILEEFQKGSFAD
ncbi:MAG: hypothetical protein HFI11_07830 [Lachnospiraceae bacterium]|nr:hypothetical protein [Lachnospiraceae bacterium]